MKIFVFAMVTALCSVAGAADDFALTYRGRIDPVGIAMPGEIDVTFRLYDRFAGGDAVWSAVRSVRPSTNGLFQCQLSGDGLASALTGSNARFIGVTFGDSGDEQYPRQEILVSPCAAVAQKASRLAPGGIVDRLEAAQIEADSILLGNYRTEVSGKFKLADSENALTLDKAAFDHRGGTLTLKAGSLRVFGDANPVAKRFETVTTGTVMFTAGENKTGGAVVFMSDYKRDWGYSDGAACITWVVGPGEVNPLYDVGHPVRVYLYPFGTAN